MTVAQTYVFRQQAAQAARDAGHAGFRTRLTKDGTWRMAYEPGPNPADQFAQVHADWCAWGEVAWVGGSGAHPRDDEDPRKVGVLVVTCGALSDLTEHGQLTTDELLARAWLEIDGVSYIVEPHDAERWAYFTRKTDKPVTYDDRERLPARAHRSASSGTAPIRERSTVESPVKLVWATADAMPGATRAEVVAACVAKGVNKSTAGVQYYHWRRAREAAALAAG